MKCAISAGNIVAPLRQGRHAHRHHIQAVIKVLAEASAVGLGAQVARGRADHPRIHLHARRAAHAREGLVDQDAQDFALGLQRHVRHFVQIKRAVMRQLEQADLARPSPCSSPNNSASMRVGRHGGAVDGDKGVAGAARMAHGSGARPLPCPNPAGRKSGRGCWSGRSCRSGRAAGRWPRTHPPVSPSSPALSFSSCTSRFSRAASSARSTTCSRRSALNGFSMKS